MTDIILREAATNYMTAVKRLGEQSGYNKLTFFEAPISKMPNDELGMEAVRRWQALNDTGKALTAALVAEGEAQTVATVAALMEDIWAFARCSSPTDRHWWAESIRDKLTAALSSVPGKAEPRREFEPGTIRICPMRDGPCPHGLHCQFVGDGYSGYPCKEGWNVRTSSEGGR